MKRLPSHRVLAFAALSLATACGTDEPGDPIEVRTVVEEAYNPALSPDGSRLAYARVSDGASAIWVADADGSDPRKITDGVWDNDPVWSPDGRWIAYAGEAPQYDVYVVPSEGGEERRITSGPAFDQPSHWLADGSAVVVSRTLAGVMTTPAVPIDGGPERLLATPMEGSQEVTLSPDGTRAAFDVVSPGGELSLWVQDLPDGEPRRIGGEGFERAYRSVDMWSPDGRSIAYVSDRTGTADIWIADAATGETRQLTTDLRNDVNHVWSPDGRWIAFVSDRGGQTDLWVVPAQGGQPRRVTDDLAVEADPKWSPDGRTLVYHSVEQDSRLELLPLGGGEATVLVDWPGYEMGWADVSPDGGTVLFVSNRSGNRDVWSVPTGGGAPEPVAASPLEDHAPSFSPDGSRVVFSSNRGGSYDLWVMPAQGGEARRLTDWPSAELYPAWSPDGSRIAFVSDRSGVGGDVWILPADGGEPAQLTSSAAILAGVLYSGSTLEWSPDGAYVYFVSVMESDGGAFRVPSGGGGTERLGSDPNAGSGTLSPDGSVYATFVFVDGWGFLEVVPTAGGTPRRLTEQSDRVYQDSGDWLPDGSMLVVTSDDFGDFNRRDLWTVSWPEGVWRRLTQTPDLDEQLLDVMPDGRAVLIRAATIRNRIRAASVGRLLEAWGGEAR